MSTKTRAQLTADALVRFPDNDSKEITAEDLRTYLIDVLDSFVSKKGDSQISGLLSFSSELSLTDRKNIAYKGYVDDSISAIDLTALWNKNGNTLTARGTFGSTSGAYGWDFKRNNTVVGGIGNSTGWFWGTNAAYTNTDHSFHGSGNTSGTYNTQWKDSGGTSLGWMRNDGILNATGFNIGGSLFARYSNGSAILQMTPETPDKTGVGSDWIGIGRFAMYAASNPQRVVALGGGVFVDATAWEDSVGLGYRAGYKNITGDRLMYIGPEAGYFNETGSDQIMIGRLATPLSGATNLNGVIVIASGGVVRQSNTGVLGSNDSPISRWVFGRGESETTTFEDVVLTAHYPANNSNQNAGGSIGFAPPAARGTGTSGDLKFYYSPAVASGTTLQTYSEAFKVRGTDGVSIFSKSAKLASYTVGTLPAQETGAIIYVSDESGGAVVAFSDGTNWRRVTDRAIVS